MKSDEIFYKYLKALEEERKEERYQTVEEIKNMSPQEREEKGRAILGLKGVFFGKEIGNITLIKFGRKKDIKTNITVSDEVIVSDWEPLKKNIEGTVAEIGKKYIIIAFGGYLPEWIYNTVRIDLFINDVTYKRMVNAIEFTEKNRDSLIYKIVNGKTSEIPLNNQKTEFFYDSGLNSVQKRTVENSLNENEISVIYGPPGTGKTRTLTEIILQEVFKGKKVLVTGDSNTSVDNIVSNLSFYKPKMTRIGHPSRTDEKIKNYLIYKKIEYKDSYKSALNLRNEMEILTEERKKYKKPTPSVRRGLYDYEIRNLSKKKKSARGINYEKIKSMNKWIEITETINDLKNEIIYLEDFALSSVLDESDIILTTNSGAGSDFVKGMSFDTVIIDEASQSTVPSAMIPGIKAVKIIVAGDHNQLPPTIISENAKNILEKSFFEIMYENYPEKINRLIIQYRMNTKIAGFSSKYFYDSMLLSSNENENAVIKNYENNFLFSYPEMIFFDTSKSAEKSEEQKEGSKSRHNSLEISIIKKITDIYKKVKISENIGIISPYSEQVKILEELYKNENEIDTEVNTIDSFQGREKDIIIISFVRSNEEKETGFLSEERRLNVALTRAKKKLILIGDIETLKTGKYFRHLEKYLSENGLITDYKNLLEEIYD